MTPTEMTTTQAPTQTLPTERPPVAAPRSHGDSRHRGGTAGLSRWHLPSLDGLRAVSISLVLLAHLAGTRSFPLTERLFDYTGDIGNLGVRVFFVISGFLITSLLLREWELNDRVSLRNFYIRRLLRIFPASYCFTTCLLVAGWLGWIALKPWDIVAAYSYTANHHYDHSWYMGHLWSLAVEEQFYLLWPFALVLLGRRRGLWLAASMLIVAPLVRFGMHEFLHAAHGIGRIFPSIADALATGCVLAGTRHWLDQRVRWRTFCRSKLFLAVPCGVMAVCACCAGHPRVMDYAGQTLMNVGIAACIYRWVTFPDDRFGRVLNSRAFVCVGVLSYSLYLWQQPFLNRTGSSIVTSFPLNLLMVVLCATASYFLIERPFLRLRKRFQCV
ncbi:MAG: acyltransferase [Sedimentisphaerales bacterium]|nr:acyltransferase [Sedimentisphaerales bacterium]